MKSTNNLNVNSIEPLISPNKLKQLLPMTPTANDTVLNGRKTICNILSGKDNRLLVIVGPCSIHDETVALEYAKRLKELSNDVTDTLYLVMRVYFEKPRTTVGWRGLIIDPYLDGSSNLPEGLKIARRILCTINEYGIPTATEMLDPIIPEYIADLVSWAAVGARTTESQTHREMASGLSMPVGFKNSTDGNLQVAIDAVISATDSHRFLGVDQEGRIGVVSTSGNRFCHLILRGGRSGTNYDKPSVDKAVSLLEKANIPAQIVVDCSHANSGKKYTNQETAWNSLIAQHKNTKSNHLVGVMLESNLFEGRQDIPKDLSTLAYGISITDECISWETTQRMIKSASTSLK